MSQKYSFEEEEPIRGLPMPVESFELLIDQGGPYRYEMIGGKVYAMAPPTPEHVTISRRMANLLEEQIGEESGPCRVFQDQWIAIPGNQASCEPDVVVTCDLADWNKEERAKKYHRFHSPLIVVEILRLSTRDFDKGEKRERYQSVLTLAVYILVEQDHPYVEVYRRSTGWTVEYFSGNQVIKLDELDLEIPLKELYRGVFKL